MATRYILTMTFGGDESEAPEDWHIQALESIAHLSQSGFTSGEVPLYDEVGYRIFWSLDAEDE